MLLVALLVVTRSDGLCLKANENMGDEGNGSIHVLLM